MLATTPGQPMAEGSILPSHPARWVHLLVLCLSGRRIKADDYNRGSGQTHRLILTRVVLGIPHVTKKKMKDMVRPPQIKGGEPNRSVLVS